MAAIFFDDDGKAYITNMLWDYRQRSDKMSAGIILQEYDCKNQKMVGAFKMIFEGTEIGQTEGPSLYKRNGWYYLMTAEGGTSFGHTVTLARSKSIWGPYETHPDKYILVSGETGLQKAGHASICCNDQGQWYMAYLCSRPLENTRCTMGRETAVQEVEWRDDDWLYVVNKDRRPALEFYAETQIKQENDQRKVYTFDNKDFLEDFMTLREPFDNGRFSLEERPGYLRMYGRESVNCTMEQSLLVHRQTSHDFSAITELEFSPKYFGHMAGLIYRYNEGHQYYCYMSHDEEKGNVVGCLGIDGFDFKLLPPDDMIQLNSDHVWLKVEVHGDIGQFYCSEDGENWADVGEQFDASQLSDDYAIGFTAAMVGMACQDLMYHKHPADFKQFIYEELDTIR